MKKYSLAILVLCVTTIYAQQKEVSTKNSKSKATLTLLRETTDLPALESVIYDAKTKLLYVSIQAAKVPGDGSIATVSMDGIIQNLKFTSGLNDPKGMAIVGNRLYVSDVLDLVEIDIATGQILNKYTQEKVRYFNDVTADSKGNVYVSDMHASSIYKLDTNKKLTEWVVTPELESNNGLLVVGNEMIIGGWGYFTDGQALLAPQGHLLKMDMNTKKITKITPEVLGNLDGLQVLDSNSYVVTDWKEGKVFQVFKDGNAVELLDTERGAADLLVMPKKKLVLLPLNKQNKLTFYAIK